MTPNTDKATARPWTVAVTGNTLDIFGNGGNKLVMELPFDREGIASPADNEDAANIALIVQAVNSYAALLAVAEAAKLAVNDRWVNEAIGHGRETTQAWVHDMRSALTTLAKVRESGNE